MTPTDK